MSALSSSEVCEVFERFSAQNPLPSGELFSVNPYTFLVAVVLSAQATDKGVNKVTESLFLEVDTPQKMLDLGEDKLRTRLSSIGLFRSKARHVIALSRVLVEKYGSEIPQDRASLEALSGVGRKTANVVLNGAFGWPTIAVDTHVFRVSRRLGLSRGKTPQAVEHDLEACVPDVYKKHAHHWLVLHGRYVCKARRPLCAHCFLAEICQQNVSDRLNGDGDV